MFRDLDPWWSGYDPRQLRAAQGKTQPQDQTCCNCNRARWPAADAEEWLDNGAELWCPQCLESLGAEVP